MARSWRSQIADEVRATSMMKPKDPYPPEDQAEIARLQAEVGRLTEFIRYAGEATGVIHSAALEAAKAEIASATAPVTYAEIDAATADPIEDCAAGFNKDALRIAVIVQRIIAARARKYPPA